MDLPRAAAHGGQRIGDRLFGVVMGVDAEMVAGHAGRDRAHDGFDLVRQRAAIGVAQHDPARAGLVGGFGAGERVIGIVLVAVEEMLAIDDGLAPRRDRRLHALGNAFEVLLQRAAERDMNLVIPALGDEHDGVGGAVEQSGDARIVGGGAPRALGHAEGGEMRVRRALCLEEFGVLRIGAGIAALDVVDAERVEQSRDLLLVVEREIDARGLGAVAQGGVEQSDAFAAHWTCSFEHIPKKLFDFFDKNMR